MGLAEYSQTVIRSMLYCWAFKDASCVHSMVSSEKYLLFKIVQLTLSVNSGQEALVQFLGTVYAIISIGIAICKAGNDNV